MICFQPTAFAEDERLSTSAENGIEAAITEGTTETIPDWVSEVADNLDVYVAQRDFEEAVSLAEKSRAFWENANPSVINLHRDLKYLIISFNLIFVLHCFNFSG